MIEFRNVFFQLNPNEWRIDNHYFKKLTGQIKQRRIIFLWIEIEE